ncbi:MAG TPA: hypothetical protein VIU12_02395 [Chryseolinea sp.]
MKDTKIDSKIDSVLNRLFSLEGRSLSVVDLYRRDTLNPEIQKLDISLFNKGLITYDGVDRRKLSYAGNLVCHNGGWLQEKDRYNSHVINYFLAIGDFNTLIKDVKAAGKTVGWQLRIDDLNKYFDKLEDLLVTHFYGSTQLNTFIAVLDGHRRRYQLGNSETPVEDFIANAEVVILSLEGTNAIENGDDAKKKLKAALDDSDKLHKIVENQRKELELLNLAAKTKNLAGSAFTLSLASKVYKLLAFAFATFFLAQLIYFSDMQQVFKNGAYLIIGLCSLFSYLKDKMKAWHSGLIALVVTILVALMVIDVPFFKQKAIIVKPNSNSKDSVRTIPPQPRGK